MTNPYAFADSFKQLFDMNQLINTQRRNWEAGSAAMQCMVDAAQAVSRRQADAARESVEEVLQASRETFASGTPEAGLARQAEVAKQLVESSVVNFREVSEMLTKSSFEAFDVLNRRAAESMEEVSQGTTPSKDRRKAS